MENYKTLKCYNTNYCEEEEKPKKKAGKSGVDTLVYDGTILIGQKLVMNYVIV